MTTYLISRHPASIQWIEQQGIHIDKQLTHLTPEHLKKLQPQDIIIGTLPIQIVAQINQIGAHYYHLTLNIPPEYRGKELTLSHLKKFNATLIEYQAKKIQTITPEKQNTDH